MRGKNVLKVLVFILKDWESFIFKSREVIFLEIYFCSYYLDGFFLLSLVLFY